MVLGIEIEEQLVHLVGHLIDPGVGPVDLVDHHHCREATAQRFRQHIPGLGHRPLGGIDEQQNPVHKRQRALDLAAEVCVTRGIDEIDPGSFPLNRRRLGENRDPALAFLVVRIHDAIDAFLVRREHAGRSEHGVNEGRLAMVDMGDQGDIAKRSVGHEKRRVSGPRAAPSKNLAALRSPAWVFKWASSVSPMSASRRCSTR